MQPNVCNTVGHTGSYAWGEHVSREAQRSSNQESLGVSHGECHEVNENLQERNEMFGANSRKISADEYWDDRAVVVKFDG